MKKIAVIGAGTMGNGITQVFAQKGFSVQMVDQNEKILENGIKNIGNSLDRIVKKGLITEQDKSEALSNIKFTSSLHNIESDTDLVIEAVYENKQVKQNIFKELESLLKPECIFASNTSSISITEIAAACRQDRFIGMHFMNPVPIMKLVEIIRGYATSQATYDAVKEMTLTLDKVPVEVNDYPGFISNRVLMPMINEAIFCLFEGVSTKEDIDTVMKLGMNHPMGPLTLADFIGLDVCLAIMEVLYNGFNDSKYRPCPLLKQMVAAGKLGKKSGEGFYKY